MLPTLPTPPSRNDPSNFSDRADAFLGSLPAWTDAANALEQSLQLVATTGTSTTSVVIGTGLKSFTTQAGKAWAAGAYLYLVNSSDINKLMLGQVNAYNASTGALDVEVAVVKGSGTYATWTICLAVPPDAAQNISGGSAGTIIYQSSANITAHLAVGTSGQFLRSSGAAAPAWVTLNYLGNTTGVGITSTDGVTRFTFTVNDSTSVQGAGSTPILFKNGSGSTVGVFSSAGILSIAADAVSAGDVPRFQQLNSRAGHTYTDPDWAWVDKANGIIEQWGAIPATTVGNGATNAISATFTQAMTTVLDLQVSLTSAGGGCSLYSSSVTGSGFTANYANLSGSTLGMQGRYHAIGKL